MIAKVYSAIPHGYEGNIVTVESDSSKSLPCFNIVGMANKTISEARERVRSAIVNSGLSFPAQRVTVNLAPAELTKNGTHLDLAIALAVLIISRQLPQTCVENTIFIGELSLNGELKPVRGVINAIEAAKTAGFKTAIVADANLAQAKLISGVSLLGMSSLSETYQYLQNQTLPPTTHFPVHATNSLHRQHVVKITETEKKPLSTLSDHHSTSSDQPTLDHVRGQNFAKRALTIAVAGHHNLLFTGPPGTGKTLLARSALTLMPPLKPSECIEVTKIHSLSSNNTSIITERPFRSPHHTASPSAIIGGGASATVGEISLAHQGVLFLDELPEYPRSVLESLRQPLEDHRITITRTHQRVTYPANFMLIATMNPCPCGHLSDPDHVCTCTETQIRAYQKHLSGPILDRIDLIVPVQKTSSHELFAAPKPTSNPQPAQSVVKNNISLALQRQLSRYKNPQMTNGCLPSHELESKIQISTSAKKLLITALDTLKISTRGYFKILKVARTIADLENQDFILPEHISEALNFRHKPTEH